MRDAAVRDQIIGRLHDKIAGSDTLTASKRAELAGRLKTKPAFARFLRTTPGGLLRINRAKVRAEANFDGKFLLRTSDESLTAADIAQPKTPPGADSPLHDDHPPTRQRSRSRTWRRPGSASLSGQSRLG